VPLVSGRRRVRHKHTEVSSLPAAGLPRGLQASQAFEPRDRSVLNRGEIAGERFFVTAAGTYEPIDDSPRCPKRIRASIERGTLHLLQWMLPLPIKCDAACIRLLASDPSRQSTYAVPPLPSPLPPRILLQRQRFG
jgi:hypothetical protein